MPSGRSQDARSTLPAMSFVCPDSKITRVTHHVRERVRVCVCVRVCECAVLAPKLKIPNSPNIEFSSVKVGVRLWLTPKSDECKHRLVCRIK